MCFINYKIICQERTKLTNINHPANRINQVRFVRQNSQNYQQLIIMRENIRRINSNDQVDFSVDSEYNRLINPIGNDSDDE